MYPNLNQTTEDAWAVEALKVLVPGRILYGYCGGAFGRDSYGNKTIISAEIESDEYKEKKFIRLTVTMDGVKDWITLEDSNEVKNLIESSNRWLKEREEDDEYYSKKED